MAEYQTNYGFTTHQETQSFHHQLIINQQQAVHECVTCFSVANIDEPYSQHWIRKNEINKLQLTRQQKAVMDNVDARNIENFFICDESANEDTRHFLNVSCQRSVPDLLRWLFRTSLKLEFSLVIYLHIFKKVYTFQSRSLSVEHHFDIDESVGMLYRALLNDIAIYLNRKYHMHNVEYTVKRIKVCIKRQRQSKKDMEKDVDMEKLEQKEEQLVMSLPLQFRSNPKSSKCMNDTKEAAAAAELNTLTELYVKYQRENLGYLPSTFGANLYCFQQCHLTKEVYIVPYHISETKKPNARNKNYLIIEDIMGNFQRLHKFQPKLMENSIPSDREICCEYCDEGFEQYSTWMLHRQVMPCDPKSLSVDSMHPDLVEIYENCIPITRNEFNHAWYGITKNKKIMTRKQFVPIECDWRTESSVNVLKGPCVVISSADSGYSSPNKYQY